MSIRGLPNAYLLSVSANGLQKHDKATKNGGHGYNAESIRHLVLRNAMQPIQIMIPGKTKTPKNKIRVIISNKTDDDSCFTLATPPIWAPS